MDHVGPIAVVAQAAFPEHVMSAIAAVVNIARAHACHIAQAAKLDEVIVRARVRTSRRFVTARARRHVVLVNCLILQRGFVRVALPADPAKLYVVDRASMTVPPVRR